ncbi:glutathione transferase GST 23-like [Aristolochia californica]|uniref:glutathione transferase GST 23-like n=1 Tax=Aristolochia californica TaxID=171875 RepID=UPI0035D7A0CB
MSTVKLFATFPSPFSYRVQWALKHKGIDYEYVEEDLQNKSSLLLKYNPIYKKIPVLLHGEKPVAESVIILEYIEEAWQANPLLPEDSHERAVARFWAKFAEEKCNASIIKAFYSEGMEQEKNLEASRESLKILDAHLEGKKFFGGERIGYTDLVVGWIPHWLPVEEEVAGFKLLDLQSFPSLCSWCENFLQDELIKNNLPAREKMIPAFRAVRERFLTTVTTQRGD